MSLYERFLPLIKGTHFKLHGERYVFSHFDEQNRIVAITHDENGFYVYRISWYLFLNEAVMEV